MLLKCLFPASRRVQDTGETSNECLRGEGGGWKERQESRNGGSRRSAWRIVRTSTWQEVLVKRDEARWSEGDSGELVGGLKSRLCFLYLARRQFLKPGV